MTGHAHARRGILGRLLLRTRHQPDLIGRSYCRGETAGYPGEAAGRHAAQQRPPWDTAEMPAYQTAYWTPLPAGTSFPAIVGDPVYGQDPASLHVPDGLVRPYAPEPQPVYEPEFLADFRQLPVFRKVARIHGHAPAGLVRQGGALPPLPGYNHILDELAVTR